MLLSINWIKEFVKLNKTIEEIASQITLSLSEVESIKQYEDDQIIEIENKALTHRGDCFSHIGIARELAAYYNLPLIVPYKNLKEQTILNMVKTQLKITIKEANLCNRYSACVLNNVNVEKSPSFLEKRLIRCGIRPINNVVDITNYTMLALGQPLHVFDYDSIAGDTIIVRRAKRNEKIRTLDGMLRTLNIDNLVIADCKKPIAIAGIMGGKNSEITKKTKTIIIESANFEPINNRGSSKKLNLRSEASTRFEKGLDANFTLPALLYAIKLLKKYVKAKPNSNILDSYPIKHLPNKLAVSTNYINQILGINISEQKIINYLNRLKFKASSLNGQLNVEVPTFRQDIRMKADIAEEVARIYGYDNIPTTLPQGVILPPKKNESFFWERQTKNFLVSCGFDEMLTNPFIGRQVLLNIKQNPEKFLRLINPISSDYEYLRQSLIPNLILATKFNQKNFNSFKLFELGRVFLSRTKKQKPEEVKKIGLMSTENDFLLLKGSICALFSNFNFNKYEFKPVDNSSQINILFKKSKTAQIITGDNKRCLIGLIGQLNPLITLAFNITFPILAAELNFDILLDYFSQVTISHSISKYPSIIQDLAFKFKPNTYIGPILKDITNFNKLIVNVKILDRYESTVTFRICFQHPNRTLSDIEITPIRNRIIKFVESKFSAKFKDKT